VALELPYLVVSVLDVSVGIQLEVAGLVGLLDGQLADEPR
jgi:hypothetical protein